MSEWTYNRPLEIHVYFASNPQIEHSRREGTLVGPTAAVMYVGVPSGYLVSLTSTTIDSIVRLKRWLEAVSFLRCLRFRPFLSAGCDAPVGSFLTLSSSSAKAGCTNAGCANCSSPPQSSSSASCFFFSRRARAAASRIRTPGRLASGSVNGVGRNK